MRHSSKIPSEREGMENSCTGPRAVIGEFTLSKHYFIVGGTVRSGKEQNTVRPAALKEGDGGAEIAEPFITTYKSLHTAFSQLLNHNYSFRYFNMFVMNCF